MFDDYLDELIRLNNGPKFRVKVIRGKALGKVWEHIVLHNLLKLRILKKSNKGTFSDKIVSQKGNSL